MEASQRSLNYFGRKEDTKMLSLEIIIGLGLLYCFFMYGLLRAAQARRAVRREVHKPAPAATQPTPQTAEQPTR